jgi:hypothetical protein
MKETTEGDQRVNESKGVRTWWVSVLLVVLATIGCTGPWTEDKSHVGSPFLGRKEGIVETADQPFSDAKTARLSQRSGSSHRDWEELADVAERLVRRTAASARVVVGDPSNPQELFVDKRLFLVSVDPDVLLLVPHTYRAAIREDGRLYWNEVDIQTQTEELIADQLARFGFDHALVSVQGARVGNWVELSTIFPEGRDIRAVSNFWPGAIPLEQAQANRFWPFEIEPYPQAPGFIRLVLK